MNALSAPTPSVAREEKKRHDASAQLEAILVKQLLLSSGVFKGSDAAGSSLTKDLFAEHLANAISGAGGMGIGAMVEHSVAPPANGIEHLTSHFGPRVDPITGAAANHTGIDIGAPEGTPIPAARAGVVISAGVRGGYGNAVELKHADGSTTLYAHAREVMVTPGQLVPEGGIVATVGQTGRSTGPHLHLEVREAGHAVDPVKALKSYRLRAEIDVGDER